MNKALSLGQVASSRRRTFSKAELVVSLIGGALLMFIGVRFLVIPAVAGEAFGVTIDHASTYGHLKGIRDLFTGVILAVFALLGDRRGTGLVLVLGSMIPVVDGYEVFSVHGLDVAHMSIHWGTALVCTLLGIWLLKTKPSDKANAS
ncbi:putative small membrane hydrophobic protein [Labilithrix luteola]|uniref:Putative small membrane hydrophobic protein n=1 Tax=Labilithrix luteola TaxID=1391654 RepID=A0A0K1PLG9_9BACT|nr:DUF4267 domain-containing protein [Labilithrix luteola]AKU93964.1 putative small membrane hydrophobic protein [Labilithrix luteola]